MTITWYKNPLLAAQSLEERSIRSRLHDANVVVKTKIVSPYLRFDVIVMGAALVFTHIIRHDNRRCQTEC